MEVSRNVRRFFERVAHFLRLKAYKVFDLAVVPAARTFYQSARGKPTLVYPAVDRADGNMEKICNLADVKKWSDHGLYQSSVPSTATALGTSSLTACFTPGQL